MLAFLQDLIIAIVGAGIGVWSAFSLFYKQIKIQRNEDLAKALDKRKDELTYFASIIKNIINVSKSQIDFLSEYVEKIETDDVNFHLLKQTPTYYLNRIVQSEKLHDYLLAYTEKFNNDSSSIRNFNQIISIIDYLYASFHSLQDQVYKSQQFDFDRKKRLEANFKEAYYHAGTVTLVPEGEKELRQNIFNVINDLNRLYNDNSSDLTFFGKHFFEPLHNLILKYFNSIDKPKEDIFKLGGLILEWQKTLSYIKQENRRLKKDIEEQKKAIENEFEKLNKISKDLLSEVL